MYTIHPKSSSLFRNLSLRWMLSTMVWLLVGVLSTSYIFCQGVGVGNNNAPPFPGAILDVRAQTKGVLLPRTDTSSILLPAKGMIIYDTLISSFAFYNGQRWLSLLSMGDYSLWWADQDGDGYGYPFNVIYAPLGPQYYVSNNLDCDDTDPAIGICPESGCLETPPCADGNPCTIDECINGICVYTNAPAGTACTLPNGLPGFCDGNGNCIESECIGTPPCDDGNSCTIDECINGICVHTNAPAGSPCTMSNGLPGICDGNGNCFESECTGSPPCDDGNPCTIDECINGICVHTPAPAGTPCSGGTCDGQGACE